MSISSERKPGRPAALVVARERPGQSITGTECCIEAENARRKRGINAQKSCASVTVSDNDRLQPGKTKWRSPFFSPPMCVPLQLCLGCVTVNHGRPNWKRGAQPAAAPYLRALRRGLAWPTGAPPPTVRRPAVPELSCCQLSFRILTAGASDPDPCFFEAAPLLMNDGDCLKYGAQSMPTPGDGLTGSRLTARIISPTACMNQKPAF